MKKEKTLVYVGVEKLLHHPDNPRKDLGELSELTESIREKGILQNLTIVQAEDSGHYYVLIGNRRMEAAKAAGLTELPCVITDMTRQEQVSTMFVENVHRADITPYEQAECLQMMLDLGESQQNVAKRTGLSEATVSRRLRLLKLDKKKFDKAQERGGGSMEQYIKISEVKSSAHRKELLDALGTDEFNRTYQKVMNEQKIKENTPKIIKEVSAFAKKAPKGVDQWSRGYTRERECRVSEWTPGALVLKKPKKDAEYFYVITSWGLAVILRKTEEQPSQCRCLSEKEKAARKLRRQLRQVTEEVYQLRRDFVLNFSGGGKDKEILFEWALLTIVGSNTSGIYRHGNFKKGILQQAIGQDGNRTYDIQKELLQAFYEKGPLSAAALIIYGNTGDEPASGYYYEGCGDTIPYHRKNKDLDMVYEYLVRLGYCMSEEEKQLQNGTHPLFEKKEEK